ncbi:MAG: acyl-CoA thioester hydrolase [Francisellaceae bacterium]|jgi:acyl-CoA thioester hydrolase
MKENYKYTLDFKVRDYECDMQAVVNNSVYQNYLEHTRHEFLLASGIDFAALAKDKINLIVVRIEIDYKYPLTSGDTFWVGLNIERLSKVRFQLIQDIYRTSDEKLIVQAKVVTTALNPRRRPFVPDFIENLF